MKNNTQKYFYLNIYKVNYKVYNAWFLNKRSDLKLQAFFFSDTKSKF